MKNYLAAAALLLSAVAASAQTVEVKGIRLGLTEAEFKTQYPSGLPKDWTVAGVFSKYRSGSLDPYFKSGVMDNFSFFFHSDGYNDVRAALLGKYPKEFKCETSEIQTKAGVAHTQERCRAVSAEGVVTLSRFVSDVSTSSLSMMSSRLLDELREKSEKKRGDI